MYNQHYMKTKHIILLPLIIASILISGCRPTTPSSGDSSNTSGDVSTSTDTSTDTATNTSEGTSQGTSSTSSGPTTSNPNPQNSKAVVTTVQALAQKKATDNKTLYRVTGTAQYAGYYKKGYFDLVDNGWTIVAYGVSSKNTCITLSGTTYSYTNDDSFASAGIKAGDTITLEGIFTYYTYSGSTYGVPELSGYPTQVISNGLSVVTAGTYSANEPYTGSYYSSVSGSDSGTALGLKLHNLMMSTHSTYVSYSSLNTTLKSTDSKCFYTGQSYSSFNREHVWPQAKSKDGSVQLFGESYAGSDIHHIRAALATYNSYRGSTMFAPIFGTPRTVNFTGGGVVKFGSGNNYGVTEPADSMKGDVARIIMYVYTHYGTDFGGTTSSGITGKLYITGVIGANSQADCFKLLRKWNADDPVSAEERSRNETAATKQGNRNPFIDHPSYADRIWN